MVKDKNDIADVLDKIRASSEYAEISETRQPWYNPHGDSVMFIDSDEETVAEWIDHYLTLYRSINDNRLIGFKLKDIKALLQEFDCDVAHIAGQYSADTGDGIKIHWLLLAACKRMDKVTSITADAYIEAVRTAPDWQFHPQLAA